LKTKKSEEASDIVSKSYLNILFSTGNIVSGAIARVRFESVLGMLL
jgi:hypothetical protein